MISAIAVLALGVHVLAQSCSNYGVPVDGACLCPAGLGGAACADFVCGNPLLNQTARPAFTPAQAGNRGSQGCGKQCTEGFDGVTCNVCTSAAACKSVASALSPNASTANTGGADNLICNTGLAAYTVNYGECDVINPTLQSVFPGKTYLDLVRAPDSTSAVFASKDSGALLKPGTAFAQLFYAPNTGSAVTEQFYCSAANCTQLAVSGQIRYDCSQLQCTCVPGTAFCGGGTLDLSQTINSLTGPLGIDCDNSTSPSRQCFFKQKLIQNLFGDQGLALSGCNFGECVQETVATEKDEQLRGVTVSSSLSGGVIAGLIVLGVLVLALAALLALGCARQRTARRRKDDTIESRWAGGALVQWSGLRYVLPQENGIGVKLRDIFSGADPKHNAKTSYSIPSRGKYNLAVNDKILLNGISGTVEPGTMLAILGPSGAGKSTLLDILSGQRKIGRISGERQVLFSGKSSRTPTIGFVDQSDVLPHTSTVREALLFAAQLKLPESLPLAEKVERVEEVMDVLGLKAISSSRIGNDERRGISGGERRRLSIGLELIARPSVLFLDEPTSGLDSFSAMRVVSVLKALTRSSIDGLSGTTVIATIHQPSSQIYHSFDSICVLALGGRQVYIGKTEAALAYFESKGLRCPSGYNPADYLLEIASEPPAPLLTHDAFSTSISPQSTDFLKQRFSKSSDVNSTNHDDPSFYPPATTAANTKFNSSSKNDGVESTWSALKRERNQIQTTSLTQFQVLAGREWNNLVRDPMLFWMHFVMALILGIFVGGLYFQVSLTIAGFQNRVGSLFFLGSIVAFSALSALNNLVQVRLLFMRERSAKMYSPTIWLFSRIVFDVVPLRVIPTIVMSTIIYWMVGLTPFAVNFFKFLLILVEFNTAMVLLNVFMAAMIRDSGIAILFSSLIDLGQMAYAGFFVNLRSIPSVLRWIQWICPLKYTLEAMTVNEISNGLLIKDNLQGANIQVGAALIMRLLFGFDTSAYYQDVLILLGFLGLFFVALVWAVLFRLRQIR